MDERDYQALAAKRAAFAAALADGDARAAAAAYAEDAWLVPPSAEPVRGCEAIAAFWHAGVAAGITSVALEALEIDVDERLGYELGRYELRLEPAEGDAVADAGSYLLVHKLHPDEGWRWEVAMLSSNEPRRGLRRRPMDGREELRPG